MEYDNNHFIIASRAYSLHGAQTLHLDRAPHRTQTLDLDLASHHDALLPSHHLSQAPPRRPSPAGTLASHVGILRLPRRVGL
jgi:hypothetical protein